jgi:hypothetical protein
MAELKDIIQGRTISYKGLMSVKEVYRLVNTWLDEQGYNPFEENHVEQNFSDGKEITVVIKGEKELSDTAKIKWKTKLVFLNLESVKVQKTGRVITMQNGSVKLSTNVQLQTDYDNTMDQTAFIYFLKVVIDKYVFKSYINKTVGKIHKQYGQFQHRIKSYLNLERF